MISKIKIHILLTTLLLTSVILSPQSSMAKGGVEKAGDVFAALIPAIGLGSSLLYEEGNEGTIQFLQSMVTSQAITFGLKSAINKTRPNGDCCNSFPSGHATAAFMGATFIHKRYGWKYAVPAYLAAAFVGYSRVQSDKHYTVDVLAGATIGILSSYYFTKPYKGFNITPLASNGIYGIHITKSW